MGEKFMCGLFVYKSIDHFAFDCFRSSRNGMAMEGSMVVANGGNINHCDCINRHNDIVCGEDVVGYCQAKSFHGHFYGVFWCLGRVGTHIVYDSTV